MTPYACFLACVPPKTSHHAKRIVRRRTRTGQAISTLADRPELVDAKALLDGLLARHRPSRVITGPVALSVTWTWPWLESDPQWLRASTASVPHARKPDVDNVAKTLIDRLVAMCYLEADQQITDAMLSKRRGDRPGIAIVITPLPTPTRPPRARRTRDVATSTPADSTPTSDRHARVHHAVR